MAPDPFTEQVSLLYFNVEVFLTMPGQVSAAAVPSGEVGGGAGWCLPLHLLWGLFIYSLPHFCSPLPRCGWQWGGAGERGERGEERREREEKWLQAILLERKEDWLQGK